IDAGAATSGSGLFTLSLSAAEVPEGTGGSTLSPGQEQVALLLPGATDRFAVTVTAEAEYEIAMRSEDFDSWLELFDANGTSIASDDDGGGGLDARIRTRLAPGDYTIQASAIGGDGGYRILISER